jgi:hypothetical protein
MTVAHGWVTSRRRLLKRRERGFRRTEFCGGTDRELAELKQKYQGNKAVTERLNRYEPFIER